jgi:ATP-dependent Clp protease ATP-binding subunit ClpC
MPEYSDLQTAGDNESQPMSATEAYTAYQQTEEYADFAKQYPTLHQYSTPMKMMERPLLGRENELFQLRTALARPELCNVLLLGDPGSGKALSDDTLIPIADERGYAAIKDIKIGDYAFGENGKPVKVVGVYPQGLKRAYSVKFPDGAVIVCNDEHLWCARPRKAHYMDRPYGVWSLREMIDYGVVRKTSSGNRKSFYIPMNGAVQRSKVDYPIHPYALGALIGDGCLSGERTLCMSTTDISVVERVADLIGAEGFKKRTSNNHTFDFVRRNATNGLKYIQQHEITNKCGFESVFNTKSSDRRIPAEYLSGSAEQRFELLNGLMDTDGSVTGNDRCNCTFSTKSKLLADDVQTLVRSLGMRASICVDKRTRNGTETNEYEVHISVPDDRKHKLFWLSRHKEKLNTNFRHDKKYNKHYDDLAVCEVEDLGVDMNMTCIRVDSENHLFQAGKEHIVTHNTALVQGSMKTDISRAYLEIDLSKMIADLGDANEMAVRIKALFEDTSKLVEQTGIEVVLFMDEFHLVVMLSTAAVEALKPMLADSGTRRIRVIAATTFTEFTDHIAANQPLVQRLQRININPPPKDAVVNILRSFAEKYEVSDKIRGTHLFEQIFEMSNKYIPANSQPRKSILLFDQMVGYYRVALEDEGNEAKFDIPLLHTVLYNSEGIKLNINVDAPTIKQRLDSKVFAQYLATSAVAMRLQICAADLHNKSKPMTSFLFTGATGVGKTELTKQLAEVMFDDPKRLIRFDMTEFALEDSLERFRAEVTARVWERPYSVLLFDEIEKANGVITRLLLQVLDDGRLIDRNNREVSFLNTYIVLTTNAASETYGVVAEYANAAGKSDEEQIQTLRKYMKVIRRGIVEGTGSNRFPPELLGRIDAICPFMPLNDATQRKILARRMEKFKDEVYRLHGIDIRYDHDRILQYLLYDKLDMQADSGGARIVAAKFEEEIVTAVASLINRADGQFARLHITVEGTMAIEDKSTLESQAYIVVSPVANVIGS